MSGDDLPHWLIQLEEEDWQFIKRFVLASGSLKELAQLYEVSYPTLRSRLDQLIGRIEAIEDPKPSDELERRVRIMMAEGKLSSSDAKALIRSHKNSMKKK